MNVSFIFSKQFQTPMLVLVGIIFYLFLGHFNLDFYSNFIAIFFTIFGSFRLFAETLKDIRKKSFGIDYIAIVAIIVALFTGQFLVGLILALMVSSGKTLEDYAGSQARKYLTKLIKRIPSEVWLSSNGALTIRVKIANVKKGEEIFIRKGEVIPLDGLLLSKNAQIDEASLTGEPYLAEKTSGDLIRSGTVNIGDAIVISVSKTSKHSTYNKIVELVRNAQSEKSPLIRLADKYSNFFTIFTFSLSAIAYILSGFDLNRVLSVLAIATPCPLIIASPVALIGGVNRAAKKNIIIKKLAALEILSRITTIVFDKTGTLTIGKPILSEVEVIDQKYKAEEVLSIASAIERNSLHPLAKTIVDYAKNKNVKKLLALDVLESLGKGISGAVNNKRFTLSNLSDTEGIAVELKTNGKRIATFKFEDNLKIDSKQILTDLKNMGLKLHIFTGDKKSAAEKIANQLGIDIAFQSDMSPLDKQNGIKNLQNKGEIVAMIGDGINDAPALALSDVGMIFATDEQTTSSEASDIVLLGGKFKDVLESLKISKKTISIATESIVFGIGLSFIGMIFASLGYIPPLFGAGIQEIIDVAVILNALRSSI